MPLPPKDCFTFTWKIENFSMCPQKYAEVISSPDFVVDSLHKSTWGLRLYPRGSIGHKDYISCFLGRREIADSSKDLKMNYRISFFCVDSEKKISMEIRDKTFKSYECWGFGKFVSLEALNKDKDTFLPNDTLTVKCELWETKEDNQEIGPTNNGILAETLVRKSGDFKGQFNITQCSVRTGIRTHKKSMFWPIEKFSALRLNQKQSIDVVSMLNHRPFLTLTFYLNGECVDDLCGQIEIQRDKNNCSEQVFVKCRVSMLNEPKKYNVEDQHLFESNVENDVWELPSFIQTSTLLKNKYLDATYDVLHLFFEFSFSYLGDEYHASSDESLPSFYHTVAPCNAYNPFQNEFKNLYKDGKFSDLTLVVGNRKFKVHKNILSTRSSVFNSMYENDMKEKQTGVVEITDLDADTVDRMLSFMYTDSLEDLQLENAEKLYSAADKYVVLPLMYRCRSIVKNALSVSNICDVLSLADLHQDVDLLDAVHNFLQMNSRKVFLSQKWKNFIASNSLLAANVMHKMLI